MDKLKPNKARVIVFIVVFAIIIVIAVSWAVKEFFSKGTDGVPMVVLEQAPQSALYRELGSRTFLGTSDDSYHIDENGHLVYSIDSDDYIVRADGSVWKVNPDGTLSRVTDQEVINKVLTAALASMSTDSNIADMLDEDLLFPKIELTQMSDTELNRLAKALGVDAKQLKDLVARSREKGETLSLEDALKTLDLTRLDEFELDNLASEHGLNSQNLKTVVDMANEDGKAISLVDAIGEMVTIDDNTMVDAYLKTLDQLYPDLFEDLGVAGLTAEQLYEYLEGTYNPETGKPYTMEEFMQMAMKDGLAEALKNVGFDIKGAEEPYDYRQDKTGETSFVNPFSTDEAYLNADVYNPYQDMQMLTSALAASNQPAISGYEEQNGQGAKKSFLVNQQNGTKVAMVSKSLNMITAGTIINGTLITGINTDLPGQIVALVSQNVYDSFYQTNLLIPKGSRLVATYDSAISYGQERILIAWNQLIRPDGVIIGLNGYQGIDSQGFSGQSGKVDNHILSIVASTGLASMVDYLKIKSEENLSNELLKAIVGSSSDAANEITSKLLEKVMNRQPTISVSGGTKITILVNDNVELPTYMEW